MTTQADTAKAARGKNSGGKSVLASDLRITGDIVCQGSVEIMGEVDGSVSAGTIIVSHEGNVKGTLTADNVELRGRMAGKIDTGGLTLRAAAQVQSEVNYTSVAIESGAQIEGSFKMKKA